MNCESHSWTWLGTDGFLGPRSGQGLAEGASPFLSDTALILMDDWCGPSSGAVTTMTENRGAEQDVTSLRQEEKPQEHTKSVHGEVQLIDTSLLMGDPFHSSLERL